SRSSKCEPWYRSPNRSDVGMDKEAPIYGLLAEFETPEELVAAARKARVAGYRRMDAYTPFPVEELAEEIGFHHTALPLIVLIGGLIGCGGGFLLQYWISAVYCPLHNAGRPLNRRSRFLTAPLDLPCLRHGP